MRAAVVFDTPYSGWDHPDHERQMESEVAANAYLFISYGHDMANAAAKAGMDYYDFIQRIVAVAITRYERS